MERVSCINSNNVRGASEWCVRGGWDATYTGHPERRRANENAYHYQFLIRSPFIFLTPKATSQQARVDTADSFGMTSRQKQNVLRSNVWERMESQVAKSMLYHLDVEQKDQEKPSGQKMK